MTCKMKVSTFSIQSRKYSRIAIECANCPRARQGEHHSDYSLRASLPDGIGRDNSFDKQLGCERHHLSQEPF
jgi:hypothetical protein